MKCWHCSEELIWGGDHESEVVRPESKQLEVIKRLLNNNGIRASLSIKVREGQG